MCGVNLDLWCDSSANLFVLKFREWIKIVTFFFIVLLIHGTECTLVTERGKSGQTSSISQNNISFWESPWKCACIFDKFKETEKKGTHTHTHLTGKTSVMNKTKTKKNEKASAKWQRNAFLCWMWDPLLLNKIKFQYRYLKRDNSLEMSLFNAHHIDDRSLVLSLSPFLCILFLVFWSVWSSMNWNYLSKFMSIFN